MDAKALAKSKRAHSLHHSKKHHPNPTSKAPTGSATASSGKKPNSKPEKQKAPQSQGSRALPSNWDRYEDEYDSGSEDVPQANTSQAPDVIMPKSKGADYAYLISEAKAQSQFCYSAESFTLFNDILDEFNQGLGPLLSARGQHMMLWSSDDNFLLDAKESSSHEASFLSLNLHSLAEQLEKTNLAERLFIEQDLLPQELCTKLQANIVGNPDKDPAPSGTEETEGVVDGLASNSISEKKKRIHQSHNYVPSDSHKSSHSSGPTSTSEGFLDHFVDSLEQLDEAGHSTSGKLTSDLSADSVTERQLRFDAGAAEAELDLLLDSISETKSFDSSVREQPSRMSYIPQGSSIQSASVSKLHLKEGDTKSSQMEAANLDDDIDDLLNETSSIINIKKISPLHEAKATSIDAPSAPRPDSKSKVLDDFDSWLDTI